MRIMDKMLTAISKYPNGTPLMIEWPDGGMVSGEIDTIYETYNDLEFEDPSYKEFYACAFLITDIIRHSKETKPFKIRVLMEISIQNPPIKIQLKNGEVIWEQGI